MTNTVAEHVVVGRDLTKSYRRGRREVVCALDGVSFDIKSAALTALVGPDGAGKTTLLRLATGLLVPDAGALSVLGIDVAKHPGEIQSRIAYMPQRFGLYEDLTVQENLDLYADLHAVSTEQRRSTYPQLMDMTGLGPFGNRLAGHLSGGMKQKLGLACALVRAPDLLVLDEPTVGVDPLSRRELWDILMRLVNDQGLTVWLSTSYLDEAQRCRHVVVLHEGRVLAEGPPQDVSALANGRSFLAEPAAGDKARDLQARLLDDPEVIDAVPEGGLVRIVSAAPGGNGNLPRLAGLRDVKTTMTPPRFEDGFMILQHGAAPASAPARVRPMASGGASRGGEILGAPHTLPPGRTSVPPADIEVEVRDLVRRFGTFTAVDEVSFDVRRGEMFGLLGPNGAGKTTTFRMLCGLLPATSGQLRVAGIDVRQARAAARRRIGYVAQKFSLYAQLSVTENLEFFGGAYGLEGERRRQRVTWALREFDLESAARLPAGQLPGGYKQRLAIAAALLHEPDTLFLDEPTSGADPLARRDFWRRITLLASRGVTAVVTTHFMEEAEYCDRIAVMDLGRILAQGTPAEIRSRAHPVAGQLPTMEDAFIAIVTDARAAPGSPPLAAGVERR